MAHPIPFKEANCILSRPANTTAEEVKSLECFRDGTVCVSRWQFTDEELAELVRNNGKVYVSVMGVTQPPILLIVETPFVENKE